MGMPAVQHDWTVERAHALPEDGSRYEVLDGELHVTPAPTYAHQSTILRPACIGEPPSGNQVKPYRFVPGVSYRRV